MDADQIYPVFRFGDISTKDQCVLPLLDVPEIHGIENIYKEV